MSLEIALRHRQGDFALDAAFSCAGGITALFGRSGAGKTTLVNLIAGLERPNGGGRIAIDGRVLVDTDAGLFVPPHRRRIGYVFQEGRLFPHLDVRRNLLYGRVFARDRRDAIAFDEVIGLLGIGDLLDRRTGGLSGGEKQRVAIGRALLARPQVLLMDEPLAALDAARKEEILPYLERLRAQLRLPVVYVSHALPEVLRLADQLVLLEEGRVRAAGPLADLAATPGLLPADGEGHEAGAVLMAEVVGHDGDYGLTLLRTPAGPVRVPHLDHAPGSRLRLRIRARDITLALGPPGDTSALNVLPGMIAAIGGAGRGPGDAMVDLRLDFGGAALLARVTRLSVDRLGLAPGVAVYAMVKAVAVAGRDFGGRPVSDPAGG
ncbi:molybdenum ABC transporter ATP-binding protein [Ferrovibrio sp.]|uniref:molybdenum ABC transporter ATP-binding protein n=1 Tax=Ferrovibrio sp. TaxID=1917215 RepID=UPI003518C7F1